MVCATIEFPLLVCRKYLLSNHTQQSVLHSYQFSLCINQIRNTVSSLG